MVPAVYTQQFNQGNGRCLGINAWQQNAVYARIRIMVEISFIVILFLFELKPTGGKGSKCRGEYAISQLILLGSA